MSEDITIKAREVARSLTYNDDKPQAKAKHLLLELANRLDTMTLRAHKKREGVLIVNALGRSRFLTFRERVCYRLFNVLPAKV